MIFLLNGQQRKDEVGVHLGNRYGFSLGSRKHRARGDIKFLDDAQHMREPLLKVTTPFGNQNQRLIEKA